MKQRLDAALAARGLARSRAQAADLIRRGVVRVNGATLTKPSHGVTEADLLEISAPPRFVSRAGEKLEAALAHFSLPVQGGRFLDVGASTGGFTDCLLQRGAAAVVGVDVGHGQMDPALRRDPRVTLHEGLNIRHVPPGLLDPSFDGAVVDVSFISLRLVLPSVMPYVKPGGWLVALVKPQFECGPDALDARGIVRDPALRQQALDRVLREIQAAGWQLLGSLPSPLPGGDGNQEHLAVARSHER